MGAGAGGDWGDSGTTAFDSADGGREVGWRGGGGEGAEDDAGERGMLGRRSAKPSRVGVCVWASGSARGGKDALRADAGSGSARLGWRFEGDAMRGTRGEATAPGAGDARDEALGLGLAGLPAREVGAVERRELARAREGVRAWPGRRAEAGVGGAGTGGFCRRHQRQ